MAAPRRRTLEWLSCLSFRGGVALALFGVVACSGGDDAASPDGGHDAASFAGDAAGVEAGGPTIALTGSVVNGSAAFAPVPDAEVCELDVVPPRCATTGTDGVATLAVRAGTRTGVTMEAADAIPMLTPIVTGTEDITMSGRTGWLDPSLSVLAPNDFAAATAGSLGVTLDSARGIVDFFAVGLNGGTVTVEGSAGTMFAYSLAGTASLVDGQVPADTLLLGFFNLEPGTVTFRAEKNGAPCEWDPLVWPGTEPGTVVVPVRAGWWTRILEVHCQ